MVTDDVMEQHGAGGIDGAVRVSEIIELLRAEYGIVTGESFSSFTSFTYLLYIRNFKL